MYRKNGRVWTKGLIHTTSHGDDEAISLLDDAVKEKLLKFPFAARFKDGARVYSCILNPEGIVVGKNS